MLQEAPTASLGARVILTVYGVGYFRHLQGQCFVFPLDVVYSAFEAPDSFSMVYLYLTALSREFAVLVELTGLFSQPVSRLCCPFSF